ncbi:hypothetical protein DL762_007046 [Monosporascus cannonballus]|uniref:Serine/threonine-protein kinase Tel1 n=1 Tax=Monosporascus cannonballus TaxID=155416 RepID=A0ABY0H158_9PEZI|nr:hypothetical protein DL762_007046 [Monosporascus cannonballus]RYO93070.1 hypothetical protein DL763_004466 [Monosporascus cannonballus]
MAPQGKEMSMAQALSSIESGSKTDRARGLDELIYHFKKRTRASDLTLEILFQCAVSEKSAYYGSKKMAKSTAALTAARLVRCAEALRLAVEHGASKLRRKTLLAVVDHIIQTLPGPNEDFVQPLLQDYIKALVALLGHAPNVELLATYDSEGWFSCVDFTLRVIDQYVQAGESDSGPSRASPVPGTGRGAISLTASTLTSTASSSQRSGSRVYRTHLQDLVQCLVSLSHASNAPLLQRSTEISSAMLQVLQLRSWGINQLHQLAFSVINALLVLTQTEDSMQASSLAIDSLPLISYWWQARSASEDDALLNGVRNEMLNVVYNSHLQLEAIVKQGSDTSVLDHVESLADTLWSEYSRREDRAQLQQDDLAYSTSPKANSIFSLEAFSLRSFSIEAEKKWAVVQILALLEGLVRKSSSPVQASADDERPRKRNLLTNDLLPYRDIADDVNAMITTADVNGPAVVVDSSLLFMTKLLHLLNYQLPSASYATCNHVVRWMFLRWDPEWPQAIAGLIGQGWSSFQEREEIVRYLLLLDGGAAVAPAPSTGQATVIASAMQVTDASNTHATKKLVSELFLPKLEEVEAVCDTWLRRGDGSSHITPERLQSTLYCLIFGCFILPQLIEVNSRQSGELEQRLFRVFERVAEAILLATENDSLYERLLTTMRPYLPRLTSTDLAQLTKEWSYLHRLFSESSAALRKRASSQSSSHHEDFMDIDDGVRAEKSRSKPTSDTIEVSRRDSTSFFNASSFYVETTQRLHLMDILFQDRGQVGLVPPSFLDDFLTASDEEILSCRYFMKELFSSDLTINPDDAIRVIERVGSLIGRAAFTSCEVALDLCLDLMDGFMPMWSDGQSELCSPVGDLYSYFLKAGLSNNLLSPKVQMSLSCLLLHLTQANGRFLESLKMPTATASLLNILENGSIPVKFYIGSRLPTMFGRYILKIHDEVFVDVLKRLPIDSDFVEGIALRLFVLAELAREWPTLLRRCVYHIFETPGNIAASKPHATHCLRKVSDSLKLDNPRMLFDLFAPQLIYTWLDKYSVETTPFEIFGFDRLEELLERAQSEVIALMVMRGQESSMADVAALLGVDLKQLLVDNFSKVIAYSMAHDISIPKTEHYQSGESRVWKILGRETFVERIYINFVDIIGLFFSLIDQESPVENSWAKDEAFTYAAKIMGEIKECGHSDVVLLPNQQPMFRAKYLTREISLLCSRTEYEMPSLWTPALVAAVARRLFNGIHHALGPLHSCAVLRKIRVLVCLAGPHALESYPLEMLLHSIRPLVTNSECADDALGLSRYLLTRGSSELSRSPSFVAGYALSTLASLRVFFETSQSSTTQESQFKATMSKAQQFHTWFRKYLDDYESPLLKSNTQRDAFRTITQSAANIRTSGNAERDTHESRLLLAIFQDEISGLHLLNEPSRRLAMEMLCGKFQIPASVTVDVVGSDQSAKELATAVWRSCQAEGLSVEYLAWAGRVVGRAFAASGYIDQDLLRESELSQLRKASLGEFASEQGILNLLQSLTTESDGRTSGLAESALRTIISEATSEDVNDLLAACQKVLSDQILVASDWAPYRAPPSDNLPVTPVLEDQVFSKEAFEDAKWAQHITVYLVQAFPASIILHALSPILDTIIGFAQKAFPYILHIVLLFEREGHQWVRRRLSTALQAWFQLDSQVAVENMTLLMNAILYLRTQRLPGERSIADRAQWLDIDLASVAAAATKCGMFKTALLFVELANSEISRASRRSSAIRAQESTDLLMNIFENIDDPDTYYGLSQTSSLSNVLARLEYEKDGSKSLAFRGAQYDSHIRRRDTQAANIDSQALRLDGSLAAVDSTFNTARRLEIWNLPAPTTTDNPSVMLYKAYQRCYQATDLDEARKAIYTGFSQTVRNLVRVDLGPNRLRHSLGAVAALTEFDDALSASDSAQLTELLSTFSSRSGWMKSGRYDEPCADLGLHLDTAVKIEAANSLWDHGEMMSSIHMLQAVDGDPNLKKQSIPVSRSDLLAKIGHQISVARLEKPESIQKNYLQPALKELRGRTEGQEAGKVYHQFAMFCDEQLQNSDSLEDLARLQHLRKGKSDEVTQLRGLISTAKDSQVRNKYQSHLAKAKQWLDLDEQELRRVEQSRSEFVRLSLENYLLALVASDEHNNDTLRFTALWLERSGEDPTNEAVRKYLDKVPTRKFALLMNQLTSRLLDQNNLFQKLLIDLVYRICVDHPYHGMYSIWSGAKARTNLKDDVAVLRQKATEKVGKRLAQTESSAALWTALDKTSKAYHALAVDRDPSRYKAGQKIAVQSSSAGHRLSTELARHRIPPPTMQIELSVDRDYSHIPYITKIEPNMTIASGVSAPKIITVVGSNGGRYKQLVKGGNDDLRQDAIMEQVFAAVSSVLKRHRSTQQRSLGIRTYKVLPLTSASGLIEFVPNTIPLHEYLMPAHERYHPKDLKGSQCRKEISQVQNKSTETRLATYKRVTERFQPVMRYFFMEYFVDPDDWFAKRTAYTRTTAAISILGHVLGLGDRHGHNILLDSKTGEVVHIDLGVAFEMGRVLPVPELVPFRLTRDIADGMGVTKTEGVFRRCCEFTLDALREETYSIMTILDVLRYDPLYSWSISPVRMAKLQDTRRDDDAAGDVESDVDAAAGRRKGGGAAGAGAGVVNEPSEADRALEVVRKKLSKTLSVTATVNDLINQATDEKNLAVLYSGWAAYA